MLTRRRFLSNSAALGAGMAAMPLIPALGANPVSSLSGYRALVCVYLGGGNDSFNVLVPTDKSQHRAYEVARGNLAIGSKSLLQLPGSASDTGRFGLHEGMPELRDLYANGEAAFLANVGAMQRPFKAGGTMPTDMLSHSGQMNQWQTCSSRKSVNSGWVGRMSDLMNPSVCGANTSMNLSVSGENLFQLGQRSAAYSTDLSLRRSKSIPVGVDFDFVNSQMAERLGSVGRPGALERKVARKQIVQAHTQKLIDSVPAMAPEISNNFASDPFSQRLAEVARLIAGRGVLNSSRQTFFVSFDGWDHHHQLLANQAAMLPVLSQGLKSFRDALQTLGVYDEVTTFTTSEFGRSLASNGSGSDHGWGGHQIILGGSVSGGKIYGEYPDLSPADPFHIGNGIYAPSTSTDEYFAELALWLGVPETQLDYVLPNLPAFRTASQKKSPVGFLA